jgi:hypothetical protein
MKKYTDIKPIYDRAKRVVESDLSWVDKYDMIFSEDISRKTDFEWYDPDCDYEDDVRAFMEGFEKWMEKLKIVHDQIDNYES